MSSTLARCLFFFLTLLFPGRCDASTTAKMFFPDNPGEALVANGYAQPLERWPASVKFLNQDKGLWCTATLIGPQAALTAAHCLDDVDSLSIDDAQGTIPVTCDRHPAYVPGAVTLANDVALCRFHKAFRVGKILYESVDINSDAGDAQKGIFLLGYGCRRLSDSEKDDPSYYGKLYGGFTTLASVLSETGHLIAKTGAVICPRDSGGAAYRIQDRTKMTGNRSVVGVNSGFINQDGGVSYITSLKLVANNFLRQWANKSNIKICGLHPDTPNCRDASP